MATLVLTTVGSAIGGPSGGAIGAILGRQVDQRVFGVRRQGARLGSLSVQTSAYGRPIPKLFGTMRVAGSVIWATGLKEERTKSGGGKGKPGTTGYSYSASFAVALSGRRIRAVHRIWADGNLLRGAAGDWKGETGFRLYPGDEAQAVDPLIASAEGDDGTPAYRGIAYVVFEDMQLADFGNRIPSLTFEIEADDGPVTLGAIAAALSDGAVSGTTAAAIGGYAADGDSVRGALEGLARAFPLSLRDDGAALSIGDDAAVPVPLPDREAIVGEDGRGSRIVRERQASGTLPDEISVTYYEPARDYQAGLQRARRGGPARRTEAIELAAVMAADAAKAVAERRLATDWAERTRARASLPWRRLDLRPGATVIVGGRDWRIGGWAFEGMVLKLGLRAMAGSAPLTAIAQPGRSSAQPDASHGPSVVELLDLPPIDDGATMPRLWLAAAGPSPGWRRASVIVSDDDGANWREAGATAAPATMGRATSVLPPGDTAGFDMIGSVDVVLLNDGMHLLSRDDDALCGGANVAMLGEEMIQFGRAERTGPATWRLTRLLRGRRGTEPAVRGHAAGDRFVLLDGDVLPIEVATDRIGRTIRVLVSGIADPVGVAADRVVTGRALRPPAPVHLTATGNAGGLRFGWTRRSRAGWAWNDGGDVPLAEEAERYRVTITPSTGIPRVSEVTEPGFVYDAAMMTQDGVGDAGTVAIEVVQLGTVAASIPARARFTHDGDPL